MNKKENKEISKDYYINTNKKVLDFLIGSFVGFFLFIAVDSISLYLDEMFYFIEHGHHRTISCLHEEGPYYQFIIFKITLIAIFIVSLYLTFKIKHRFIAFGIAISLFFFYFYFLIF